MTLPRTSVWRREDVSSGLSVTRLAHEGRGYRAEGSEVAFTPDTAWSVQFIVTVDGRWITREVDVAVVLPSGRLQLLFEADGGGGWHVEGADAPELDGCLDVDIAATPFTNTLPIRRLNLDVGEARDIRATWIDVPSLHYRVAEQRYTRLDPLNGVTRYEYRALESGNSYRLTVDDEGIVVDYERFASRLASY